MPFSGTTSLVTLLIVWGLSSELLQTDVFPGPLVVFASLAREALSGELWVHLSATLGRVLAAFGLAWIASGCISGQHHEMIITPTMTSAVEVTCSFLLAINESID